MKISIKTLLFGISICTSSILFANNDVLTLDEIIITEEVRNQINNKIIVDEAKIVQFNDATAGEVLRRIAGVTFAGEPSEGKNVRLRGLDTAYTQVLINGQRVPGSGEKREFEIDLIPANMIERIEIIRTPTANIDSQGIAGTINIILKQTPQARVIIAKIGMRKLGHNSSTPNASFIYGDKIDNLSYLISLNAQKRDLSNDKIKYKYKYKSDGKLSSKKTEIEDEKFDEIFFSTRFNLDIDEKNTLTLNSSYSLSKKDKTKEKTILKKGKFDSSVKELNNQKRSNLGIDTTFTHKLNDDTKLSLMLMIQESKKEYDKNKTTYDKKSILEETELETENIKDNELSIKFTAESVVSEKHTFDYGIDYSNKKREKNKYEVEIVDGIVTDKTSVKDKYSVEENRVNAFFQDEFTINDNHTLSSGIRFEWAEFSANDVSGLEHKSSNILWNPSINYLYNINKNNNLKIGLAKTVTRPDFDELNPYVDLDTGTLDEPDKVGNHELKPETAYGIDIAIEHYFEENEGLLSANIFYRDIKDKMQANIILNNENNRYQEMFVNQGNAKVKGLELEASYDLSYFIPNLNLSSNITFLNGKIKDKKTGKVLPLADMPDYVYNIAFTHKFLKSYKWGMNYNYVSKRENEFITDDIKTYEYIKSQKRLDFFLKSKLNKNYTLNFAAENLLKVKNDTRTRTYENGSLEDIEDEIETSQRVYMISLTGKF